MNQGRKAFPLGRRARGVGLVMVLTACTMLSWNTRASGVPVIDFINWIQNYLQQYQATGEYGEEAKRWYDSYEHMQQQLIRLEGLATSMGPMSDQFSRRAEDYGMVESCRGSQGSPDLSALKQAFVPDLDGDIQQQQIRLCERIILAENAKYNETVDMLGRLRKRAEGLQKIEQRRTSVGSSQGALESNDNDVARFAAGMQVELQHWEAMITGYDSYIGLLRMDQQRLATRAMQGSPWGTLAQGVVLKGALEAAGAHDR